MQARTPERPQAVLFDLDGTLYDQRPLRKAMLGELARSPFRGPLRALRMARRLKLFRLMREDLRELGDTARSLDNEQYERPAEALGEEPSLMRATVTEWMYERPLPYLRSAAWPSLRGTLETLRGAGLRLGCFSDYPPASKLRALGVDDLFDVAIGATDVDVNAFKPHPRGFLVGAEKLGHDPAEVTYVGDRVDVDAMGAQAAGMHCVILAGGVHGQDPVPAGCTHQTIQTFDEVPHALRI